MCVTDEEVFRYLPAVTVATVDKLAAVGRIPELSHFTAGPAHKCPDHGYFTHHQPVWKEASPARPATDASREAGAPAAKASTPA